ncbi:ABC transporter permease [Acuticoccus mangrovi]|uniref:ABC transporter permease n=1 Tax=Acuticoccus mangrovi TaxID=2796142 RepID=A0A934IN52_9HYPH|nr:ABC transporter permease [Acuticoccus mangrovi]MBJ3777976.1 ABC transporter permease [Acuticoccus mangrovi]
MGDGTPATPKRRQLTLEQRHALYTALLIAPATLFMLFVYAVPLAYVVSVSLADKTTGAFSIGSYQQVATSSLFYKVTWTTLQISALATITSLLLAYPIALYMNYQSARVRAFLMLLVLVPFWTSILVKSYAFTVIFGQAGVVNQLLGLVGLPSVKLLFNRVGVIIGMTHYLVPFLVLTILTSLRSIPPDLPRAASIMGASKLVVFRRVVLPLSMPGVIAGSALVFILSLGFYVVPALLGGRQDVMLANLVEFYLREALNWQMASTIAVMLLLTAALFVALLFKTRAGAALAGEQRA